jgi:predicted transcriptional regulator of viral defense system
MSTGTKITEGLTTEQISFLHYLDNEEIQLFSLNQLRKNPAVRAKKLNEIIENLEKKHFLCRLERGTYCRSTFHDENVIGTFLAPDGAVAYWTALNLHGLTEQFAGTIFIQTTCKKEPKSIFGTSYRFIKIKPEKRTGIQYNGYGNHQYPITDIEKTIVDCFDLLQYSGGVAGLIKAYAKADLDAGKMIDYCAAINNSTVTRRLGFLAELFGKETLSPFVSYARTKVNKVVAVFDPAGTQSGELDTAWQLRLNISKQDIINIIQNPY